LLEVRPAGRCGSPPGRLPLGERQSIIPLRKCASTRNQNAPVRCIRGEWNQQLVRPVEPEGAIDFHRVGEPIRIQARAVRRMGELLKQLGFLMDAVSNNAKHDNGCREQPHH